MAIETKSVLVSGRVTPTKFRQVEAYLEGAGLRQADMVRQAINEFMRNHPAKQSQEPLV